MHIHEIPLPFSLVAGILHCLTISPSGPHKKSAPLGSALFSGQLASSKYARRDIVAALKMTEDDAVSAVLPPTAAVGWGEGGHPYIVIFVVLIVSGGSNNGSRVGGGGGVSK